AQGTGGDQAQVNYTPPGGVAQPVPFTALYTPDPLNLGNAVSVAGTSSIQVTGGAFTAVGLGALSLGLGSTLNVASAAGKRLNFTSTTLVGGAVALNDTADVALGQVTSTPATVFSKAGIGQLFLNNTAAGAGANNFTAATIDIQAGKVVAVGSGAGTATNPLGPAA